MSVSSLGDWVGFIAVASLVTSPRLGGSTSKAAASAVAGVMIARMLPSLLFGPFAGVLVDRFDRQEAHDLRRHLARRDVRGRCRSSGSVGRSTSCRSSSNRLALLWAPAKDSSVPNLVPATPARQREHGRHGDPYGTLPLGGDHLHAARRAGDGARQAGPYFARHKEFLALWLDGLSFLFSAYMVSRLPIRAMRPKSSSSSACRTPARTSATASVPTGSSARPGDDRRHRRRVRGGRRRDRLGPISRSRPCTPGRRGGGSWSRRSAWHGHRHGPCRRSASSSNGS